MGVFGAVFGCRGDVGFKGPLLGASRGVVGFNVTTLLRLVREKVRPAWLDMCVSAKKFALCAHNGSKLAFSGVLGEVFRGRAAGGAVLGEFFRGPAVVGSHRANIVAPQPWPPAILLAVLTLQCAATPYGWHGGQPAQATTHRVNVRRMCSQRWGLESSQAPGAFHISRETTEAGSRRIPPLVACGGRAVNAEKSAPETQHPSLSLATVATGASRRTLSSSTSP